MLQFRFAKISVSHNRTWLIGFRLCIANFPFSRPATEGDVDKILRLVNEAYKVEEGNSGLAFKRTPRYQNRSHCLADIPHTIVGSLEDGSIVCSGKGNKALIYSKTWVLDEYVLFRFFLRRDWQEKRLRALRSSSGWSEIPGQGLR